MALDAEKGESLERHFGYYDNRKEGLFAWFDYRFLLILAFIAISFIKNSGCTSVVAEENKPTRKAEAVAANIHQRRPLVVKTVTLIREADGNYSSLVSVSGGREPYAFFLSEKCPHTISFLDSHTVRITFEAKGLRNGNGTVYVLDGNGDISTVSIKIGPAPN